jgi:hypothetical protein
MILEILLGFILGIILIYLWLLYLKWGNVLNENIELYDYNRVLVESSKRDEIDKWRLVMPSPVLSDTYKYINFWMLYYYAKYIM